MNITEARCNCYFIVVEMLEVEQFLFRNAATSTIFHLPEVKLFCSLIFFFDILLMENIKLFKL